MKRIITLLLVLTIGFGCVGCKNVTPTDSSSADSVTETVAESVFEESFIPSTNSEPIVNNFDITLTFLGDMILANQKDVHPKGRFEEYAQNNPPEYFLSRVKDILSADDFTLANLENVFSDRDLPPKEKNYSPAFWFKTNVKNLDVLKSGSIDSVLITNNHIMDYGDEGYKDTQDAIANAGINYGTDYNVIRLEKNGFKIDVICTGLWGQYNINNTINRLKKSETESDFQIVFFHGGTEKIHAPEQFKVDAAHAFVDNGADLVVGGHPHVLQPREIYNGVEIVYSLGNFCYGGALKPENRTVIYQYTLTVNNQSLALENKSSNIIPCYVYTGSSNNYQPAPITNEAEKQKVLDFMNWKTDSPV
ncbi:MAG: CapA family protein [Clostridia bacterium]|nr:CapA family protein [Clostridia bacterium]